jgi:hypothetical protein
MSLEICVNLDVHQNDTCYKDIELCVHFSKLNNQHNMEVRGEGRGIVKQEKKSHFDCE